MAALSGGASVPGKGSECLFVPIHFGIKMLPSAEGFQSLHVANWLRLQVPAEFPQADRTQLQRPSVPFLLVVAAVHEALECNAMLHRQDVDMTVAGAGAAILQLAQAGGDSLGQLSRPVERQVRRLDGVEQEVGIDSA